MTTTSFRVDRADEPRNAKRSTTRKKQLARRNGRIGVVIFLTPMPIPNLKRTPALGILQDSLLLQRKEKIESQADILFRHVGVFAGVVVVLVVGVEFDVFANRKNTTGEKRSSTPLVVLTLIIRFGGDIRNEVIGMDGE